MKKDLQPLISAFIASYRNNHPYSPTIREISDGTGIPRATVGRTVEKMRTCGLLEYSGHRKILPTGEAPSDTGFRSVPVYLNEDALLHSVPDGTALLPAGWTGTGDFLMLAAPETCSILGISAGDPLLIRVQEEAEPELPVLWRAADQKLHLSFGIPDASESPAVLGAAVRVFRSLAGCLPQGTAQQECPL